MQYIKLNITLNPEYQELFIAELDGLEFDGFQQDEDELIAYIRKKRLSLRKREQIDILLTAYPGSNVIKSEEIVLQQNWNRQWERTIQPQSIGPFLVKPTWSDAEPTAGQIVLKIDPKMAFGTGYHPTTRLMLREIPDIITGGCSVLDAGTGSGILAIAAAKAGAAKVLAFDNDEWCVRSTIENVGLNDADDRIDVRFGDQSVIEGEDSYDVILVNITLVIIKKMIPTLVKYLKNNGYILLTGLLTENIDNIRDILDANNLKEINLRSEKEWILVKTMK